MNLLNLAVTAALLAGNEDVPDLELKRYQLGRVFPLSGPRAEAMALIPYRATSRYESDLELDDDTSPIFHQDELLDLILQLIYPEYWEQQGWLEFSGESTLWVAASAEVHDELRKFLEFLENQFVGHQRLELRCFRGTIPPDLPWALPHEQASHLLQDLVERGALEEVRAGSAAMLPWLVQTVQSTDVEPFVYSWVISIAQGMTVGVPVDEVLATGLRASFRTHRLPGGTLLELLLRQSDKVKETVVRRLKVDADVRTNAGLSTIKPFGVVEHPVVGFAAFAGSVWLPDGHAALVPVSLSTQSGAVDYLLELRVTGPAPRWANTYELPAKPGSENPTRGMQVLHFGGFESSGIRQPTPGNTLFDPATAGENWFQAGDQWTATILKQWQGVVDNFFDAVLTFVPIFDDDSTNQVRLVFPYMISVSPKADAVRIRQVVQTLAPERTSFVVDGVLRENKQKVLGRFRVPLVSGFASSLWTGVQNTAVIQWEQEVANDVAVSVPEFFAIIDGMAAELRVRSDRDSYEFEIAAKLNFLKSPMERFDLETKDGRESDKPMARTLFVTDRRRLSTTAPTVLEYGDSNLSLELTITTVQ